MGTLVGHVAPGIGFLLIGLWHLFNHIKLHALHPTSYTAHPWFPSSKHRHLELFLIMAGPAASISMELFSGPRRHQPFDSDGSIPSNHLHNFEHASISLTFFFYALLSILLDKWMPLEASDIHGAATKHGLTQFLGAVAFGQQLLLFHLHSADHMGPEGQYHLVLQLIVVVSLITTVMGIGYPRSFVVSFIRSLSIFFQGVWLVVMGFMLWTPSLIPKGCFMHFEEGHHVVRCPEEDSLHRAKSLVNLEFSWFFIGIAVFGVSFYLVLTYKIYGQDHSKGVEYFSLGLKEKDEDEDEDEDTNADDVESQKKSKLVIGTSKSFIEMGKSAAFGPIDMER